MNIDKNILINNNKFYFDVKLFNIRFISFYLVFNELCIFFILVSESYKEFQEILEDRLIAEQTTIIERMIKVNHPSLGNNNRSNLQRLYLFLLQHLNDYSSSMVSNTFQLNNNTVYIF